MKRVPEIRQTAARLITGKGAQVRVTGNLPYRQLIGAARHDASAHSLAVSPFDDSINGTKESRGQ
jgi:hypothetical protein